MTDHKLPTLNPEGSTVNALRNPQFNATCRENGAACSQDHRFPALRLQHGGQSKPNDGAPETTNTGGGNGGRGLESRHAGGAPSLPLASRQTSEGGGAESDGGRATPQDKGVPAPTKGVI